MSIERSYYWRWENGKENEWMAERSPPLHAKCMQRTIIHIYIERERPDDLHHSSWSLGKILVFFSCFQTKNDWFTLCFLIITRCDVKNWSTYTLSLNLPMVGKGKAAGISLSSLIFWPQTEKGLIRVNETYQLMKEKRRDNFTPWFFFIIIIFISLVILQHLKSCMVKLSSLKTLQCYLS